MTVTATLNAHYVPFNTSLAVNDGSVNQIVNDTVDALILDGECTIYISSLVTLAYILAIVETKCPGVEFKIEFEGVIVTGFEDENGDDAFSKKIKEHPELSWLEIVNDALNLGGV